jgi:hypothetical protein
LALSAPTCRWLPLGPGAEASENRCFHSFLQKVGIGPLRLPIVGLLPRVLSLTPKVTFSFSGGRLPLRSLPRFGSYCASEVIAGFFRRLPGGARTPRWSVPFSHSGCDTGLIGGRFCLSKTAGVETTTLAHSSNFRLLTDCVHPAVRNHGRGDVTRLRGWLIRYGPLVCRVLAPRPLAA